MKNLLRVIIPDSHGLHIDPLAEAAFLDDLRLLDPHEIVMLGDHLDCGGTFNAHQRSYTNEMTESYADDCKATNRFLNKIQKRAPRARIHYLEGNHEQHVERWAARNFQNHKDAVGLLDVFGPKAVLDLKRRGISYYQRSTQYMGLSIPGTIKLGKCYFVHGISFAKHCAAVHLARFGANVVFGHVHRMQSVNERTVTSDGYGAWCPGTLAKLQPLYQHTAPTSWTHGYGVQFCAGSGAFIFVNVPIHKGKSLLHTLRTG
jgi:UDP-2,3-diacylglucosamine pyrophosphatase LpxH